MWKPQGWHVMCSQVSVSYIKYMCPQYCAAMHSDACTTVLTMCWACVLHVSLNLIIMYIGPNIGMIQDKIRSKIE